MSTLMLTLVVGEASLRVAEGRCRPGAVVLAVRGRGGAGVMVPSGGDDVGEPDYGDFE